MQQYIADLDPINGAILYKIENQQLSIFKTCEFNADLVNVFEDLSTKTNETIEIELIGNPVYSKRFAKMLNDIDGVKSFIKGEN